FLSTFVSYYTLSHDCRKEHLSFFNVDDTLLSNANVWQMGCRQKQNAVYRIIKSVAICFQELAQRFFFIDECVHIACKHRTAKFKRQFENSLSLMRRHITSTECFHALPC